MSSRAVWACFRKTLKSFTFRLNSMRQRYPCLPGHFVWRARLNPFLMQEQSLDSNQPHWRIHHQILSWEASNHEFIGEYIILVCLSRKRLGITGLILNGPKRHLLGLVVNPNRDKTTRSSFDTCKSELDKLDYILDTKIDRFAIRSNILNICLCYWFGFFTLTYKSQLTLFLRI